MNKTILLDVDGVLADFTNAVLRIGNEFTGMNVTLTDVRQWDLFDCFPKKYREDLCVAIQEEGFCEKLKPYKGALEAVQQLRRLGDVFAVTSPWSSKTWCSERSEWLKEHFQFASGQVIHASAKYLVRGDVLIDDKPENLQQWGVVNRGLCLLVDAPYNQRQDPWPDWVRVNNWDQIVRLVKAHLRAP